MKKSKIMCIFVVLSFLQLMVTGCEAEEGRKNDEETAITLNSEKNSEASHSEEPVKKGLQQKIEERIIPDTQMIIQALSLLDLSGFFGKKKTTNGGLMLTGLTGTGEQAEDHGGEKNQEGGFILPTKEEVEKAIATLQQELETNILREEYIVEDTGQSVSYRIDPEKFCSHEQKDEEKQSHAGGDDGLDSCINTVRNLYPVLRFTGTGKDSMTIDFLVTHDQNRVATFTASGSGLALTVWAEGMGQFVSIIHNGENPSEEMILANPWTGAVTLELKKVTENTFTAEILVKKGLFINFTLAGREFSGDLAATESLAKVTVDVEKKQIDAEWDLQGLKAEAPLRKFFPEESIRSDLNEAIHQLVLNIDKIRGSAIFEPATDTLTLTDVSFGDNPSTLKYKNQTLLAFSMPVVKAVSALIKTEQNSLRVKVPTGLSILMNVNFSVLKDVFDQEKELPGDEEIEINLTGDLPALRTEYITHVESGTLSIAEHVSGLSFVVTEGQCFAGEDDEKGESHWLRRLSVQSCDSPLPW